MITDGSRSGRREAEGGNGVWAVLPGGGASRGARVGAPRPPLSVVHGDRRRHLPGPPVLARGETRWEFAEALVAEGFREAAVVVLAPLAADGDRRASERIGALRRS